MNEFNVLIGAVGTLNCMNKDDAFKTFLEYMELSSEPDTHVSGEKITLTHNGKILDVYYPLNYVNPEADEDDDDTIRPDRQ